MNVMIHEGDKVYDVNQEIADILEHEELIYFCTECGSYHHDMEIVVWDDLEDSRAWSIIETRIKQLEAAFKQQEDSNGTLHHNRTQHS